MLRIMKYLSKAEIGQMLIALVTIVGQVYFDLKLPDYMSDITTPVSYTHLTLPTNREV